MISSAVIVPEPEDLSPVSPSHKRRQSSSSYNDPFKRPRLDTGFSEVSNRDAVAPSTTSPSRRKPSVTGNGAAEERKRGQRLFGALLGTLSQSSTTTAQRRRADIEKKQLGKLQQRDEEVEEEKRRKREKLDVTRRSKQTIWDEHSMRARHRNMLAEAHFLRTKAEPRLFYKPWELRPEEVDQIKAQIEDAETTIVLHVGELQARKRSDEGEPKAEEAQHPQLSIGRPDGVPGEEQSHEREEAKEPNEKLETRLVGNDTTNAEQVDAGSHAYTLDNAEKEEQKSEGQAKDHENNSQKHEEKSHDDHGGEELVEGQEDDVIY